MLSNCWLITTAVSAGSCVNRFRFFQLATVFQHLSNCIFVSAGLLRSVCDCVCECVLVFCSGGRSGLGCVLFIFPVALLYRCFSYCLDEIISGALFISNIWLWVGGDPGNSWRQKVDDFGPFCCVLLSVKRELNIFNHCTWCFLWNIGPG